MDVSNFSEDHEVAGCKSAYFPNAIVVTRHGEVEGIINIGCNELFWFFEPKCKAGEC